MQFGSQVQRYLILMLQPCAQDILYNRLSKSLT